MNDIRITHIAQGRSRVKKPTVSCRYQWREGREHQPLRGHRQEREEEQCSALAAA